MSPANQNALKRREKHTHRRELGSLFVAVGLVLVILFFAYRSWSAYSRYSEQTQIAQQMINGTSSLLNSLLDAETGQRGYILTGQENYLEPYRQGIAQAPAIFENLMRISREYSPDQLDRLDKIRPLQQAKLQELAQTIVLRRSQGINAALPIVQSGIGLGYMDQIRHLCLEIQAVETGKLVTLSQASRAAANQLGLISTLGTGLLFALLVFSTLTIDRASRRRQKLIAELRASEARVTEGRNWLQTTLTSIGDAVMATDSAGRIVFLNSVAQNLTGWDQNAAAGRPLEEIFVIHNEATGAVVENPVDKALREGTVVGLANHTELTSKSGVQIPIEDSAAPIRNEAGEVSGVVLVFRDVTERRAADQALERSMERFQVMADHAPVLIWIAGVDQRGTWFNQPWLDFTGRTLEQEVGSLRTEHIHPDDLDRCLQIYQDAYDHRHPFTLEYRLRRHDGVYRWFLGNGLPLYESNHNFSGYIGSCIDITERKEAEERLQRANQDLSQFAFAASHDLQEPLRMITSYSQMLVKGYGKGNGNESEASMCVRFITEGTERMRDLLADLLAYTQLSADRRQSAPVDLNGVFEEVIDNLKVAIAESKATVTCDPLPVVQGQQVHFVELLQNLIENAIKYRGDAPLRVHVSAKQVDEDWQISVADNGIGIDPQYQQQIFGVFKRLHGRKIPGTGIGLAICQRVAERYGGRIWVESRLNEGATFHVTIPALEAVTP